MQAGFHQRSASVLLFSSPRIRVRRHALSCRHRPFKALQGLSPDDGISFFQRTPVIGLRCYRDTRLRDDT